jgi:hypothetical protein
LLLITGSASLSYFGMLDCQREWIVRKTCDYCQSTTSYQVNSLHVQRGASRLLSPPDRSTQK